MTPSLNGAGRAHLERLLAAGELSTEREPDYRPAAWREIGLFAVVRNESLRLPYFLSHCRDLGVDRMFIVDHASTDGTPALLAADPRVHLFRARGPFRNKMIWLKSLLNAFGVDRWCLVLDADEILRFPGQGRISLRDLCEHLTQRGCQALRCFSLDMYPAGPLAGADYRAGQDPLAQAPFFDRDTHATMDHLWSDGSVAKGFLDVGGVRKRVFGLDDVCLTKFPLLRYHPRMRLGLGMHVLENATPAEIVGTIMHFKFLQDFHVRVEEEMARGAFWKSGKEYRAYHRVLAAQPAIALKSDASLRYAGEAQLVRLGVMRSSAALEAQLALAEMLAREERRVPEQEPGISVVVRSCSGKGDVLSLLNALATQDLRPCEFVVIDSGSPPAVLEAIEACESAGLHGVPLRLIRIPAADYRASYALNTAIASVHGSLVAIISQDAMPAGRDYLRRLARSLAQEDVAGAYARQVLPPGVRDEIGKTLATVYNDVPRAQTGADSYFANTCSLIRRSLWEQHHFREDIPLAEDHEWARWVQRRGFVVHYRADVEVVHYHAYRSCGAIWRRYFDEGLSLGVVYGTARPAGAALKRLAEEVVTDRRWLIDSGAPCRRIFGKKIPAGWWSAALRRAVQHAGLYSGFRAGGARSRRVASPVAQAPPAPPPRREQATGGKVCVVCAYGIAVTSTYREYLDRVLAFLEREQIRTVIASGGRSSADPFLSEAGVIAGYFANTNPNLVVHREEESLTTLDNLMNCRALLGEKWEIPRELFVCCDRTRFLKVALLSACIFPSGTRVQVVPIARETSGASKLVQAVSLPVQALGVFVPAVRNALQFVKQRRVSALRRAAASHTRLF